MITLIRKEVQKRTSFFHFYNLKNFNWRFFKISSKLYCKRFGILVVYICKKDKEKLKWKESNF